MRETHELNNNFFPSHPERPASGVRGPLLDRGSLRMRDVAHLVSSDSASDRRVLFFGDSFVAGHGDPAQLGWVGRVTRACHATGNPITAFNLGVRGETSADVARRWRAEAEPRLAPDAQCKAVFSFGANDAIFDGDRHRVPVDESTDNLRGILDDAIGLGLDPLVVSAPPILDPLEDDHLRQIVNAYEAACSSRGVRFIRVFERLMRCEAWVDDARSADGTHPAERGYAEMAEIVMGEGFLAWLREPAGAPAEARPT